MTEKTIRCPICTAPYVFYSLYCGDQSACPDCRAEDRRRFENPTPVEREKYRQIRNRYFHSMTS